MGAGGMARGEVASALRERWRWEREVALGEEGGEGRGKWQGAAGVVRGSSSTMNRRRIPANSCHMCLFAQMFRTLISVS